MTGNNQESNYQGEIRLAPAEPEEKK